ncbi:A1S_2505 family phage non-structural protein, partial [Pedobacter cryoconitis]
MLTQKITPSNISKLKKNEVFVFGSNLNGHHIGGAAKLAKESFGAIENQGKGIQGKSYGIPTLNYAMAKISIENLQNSVNEFGLYASENLKTTFFVTEIGCGIAGFKSEEVAPLFKNLVNIDNITLPQSFVDVIESIHSVSGFKGFGENLICRDFQYKLGESYTTNRAKCCDTGFHFCLNPFDVWNYYPPTNGNRFTKVEGGGQVDTENTDSKVATTKIKIGLELNLKSFIEGGVKFIFEKT